MIKKHRKRKKTPNMTTYKKVIISVLLSFISFVLIIPNSLANPIPIGPDFPYFGVLICLFLINLSIEYFVIFKFISKYVLYRPIIIKSVFLVNLFTFPITQFIALIILLVYPFAVGLHFTAELFPLVVETILFLKINKIKYHTGELRIPIPRTRTIAYTITANLITFSLGLVFFMQYTKFYYA